MSESIGGMPASAPPVAVLESAACAPLARAALSAAEAGDLARRLKVLADPARLRLLSLLMAAPQGEACTCDLTEPLGLSQPTVSHHLKKLAEAGLITGERRGVGRRGVARREAARRRLQPLPG